MKQNTQTAVHATESDVAKGHAGHADQDQKITNISFS